jgi:arylformamidase
VDLKSPIDLSWRVRFDEAAPRAFGLPPARTRAVEVGGFVGDTRRGGSCNCETHTLTPHGDGTHTEGVGHILQQRVPVVALFTDALLPCLVLTVAPVPLASVSDDVSGNHAPEDRVIDELSLQDALTRVHTDAAVAQLPRAALVVRTRPATAAPASAYTGTNPPYFTVDAAAWVRAQGFAHVIVDLPSLDREDDGGLLGAHHAFFDVTAHQHSLAGAPESRTVTELARVPADVADGAYALSLQLAPLEADAVPSRPLLYPLVRAPLAFAGAAR